MSLITGADEQMRVVGLIRNLGMLLCRGTQERWKDLMDYMNHCAYYFVIFLYLLIAGADESRRKTYRSRKKDDDHEKDFNGM